MENRADKPRLIERGFPLKQASLDSVHEKNVRHGHISTLHIWPARRPLAACRAALIATLLPDPGDPEERRRLLERIGGRVISKLEKKKVNGKPVEVERERFSAAWLAELAGVALGVGEFAEVGDGLVVDESGGGAAGLEPGGGFGGEG